jgi:hypothetical protein
MNQLGGTMLESLGNFMSEAGATIKNGAVAAGNLAQQGYYNTKEAIVGVGAPAAAPAPAPAAPVQTAGRRRKSKKGKKLATKKAGRRSHSRKNRR